MSNLVLAKPQVIATAQKLVVRGTNFIAKQSPIILAGTAIVGVCTTAYLATKAGIQADELIKEAEYEKKCAQGEDATLTIAEKVQTSWKAYAPTVISGGLTIGAIVASSAISQRRQAALAGLYALSETALKEYQDKIEQKYGPKDAQLIKDEINANKAQAVEVPKELGEMPTGKVLCFDKLSGRYFMSSVESLRKAANDLNHSILSGDMCASVNELYSNMGLEECGFGEDIGWNLDCLCDLYFTSCLTSDMKPCLVIDYVSGHEPNYRYRDI